MAKKTLTNKLDNKGFSLIELLVVIAMMGILTGGAALSVNLLFSKDAAKCATKINDVINEVRMESMSKAGAYEVEFKKDSNDYYAVINGGDPILLNEKGRIKSITVAGPVSKDFATDTLKLSFDKSKGNVDKIDGSNVSTDGVIVFTVTQNAMDKEAYVSLVTSTGKHQVGQY